MCPLAAISMFFSVNLKEIFDAFHGQILALNWIHFCLRYLPTNTSQQIDSILCGGRDLVISTPQDLDLVMCCDRSIGRSQHSRSNRLISCLWHNTDSIPTQLGVFLADSMHTQLKQFVSSNDSIPIKLIRRHGLGHW